MIKPYYEEPDIKIYQGHVLEVLRTLGDESVNTIITSPPYWGLRDYGKDTKTTWDGTPSCAHQFKILNTKHDNRRFRASKRTIVGNNKNPEIYPEGETEDAFCYRCGAWYGQLGLEPTLDFILVICYR